jgi:hypothetical protein
MASTKRKKIVVAIIVVLGIGLLWFLYSSWRRSIPAQDEAMERHVPLAFFDQAANEADYFHDMDGGARLTPAEIRGRNTWMAWTGGDEAFWDWLADNSFGTFDLLKTISSYPCSPAQEQRARASERRAATTNPNADGGYGESSYSDVGPTNAQGGHETGDRAYYASGVCDSAMWPQPGQPPYRYYNRDTRFCYTGLINQPGFVKPTAPDEYGLCLDRDAGAADSFDPKVYGRPSGVLGLRVYPNPNFDAAAKQRWMQAMKTDAFYTDPKFFTRRDLVRPYRVGMACSFCHVSPHPLHPPADPENPKLADLSGTIGAQYFWFGRVFGANVTPDNFIWHMLGSQRPGSVDTSFVPHDNVNNPRALNAIFNLGARLENGKQRAIETSAGPALLLPEVATHKPDYTFGVPHILWDGADSVGVDAALTRVYLNIGEYHQEWIRHISPVVGLGKQSPITVKAAQENSVYWNATQKRSHDMAAYLIRGGSPMPLAEAPGGADYLQADAPTRQRGRVVFAQSCARCHSSKQPPQPQTAGIPRLGEKGCIGDRYLDCWNNYWKWTETPEFKTQMTQLANDPDFLKGNYLSTDARIPVTLLQTEICSSMASNSIAGHVWDNFSSQSYKDLPSVGPVNLYDPIGKKTFSWDAPGGGRGYQRVPSLIAVWATAPFLHNNEVGSFTGDPSLKGRMEAFEDSISQLLWPERRKPFYHRTQSVTNLTVDTAALPALQSLGARLVGLVDDGKVKLGPIPAGTPVNLLANINAGGNDPQVGLWTLLRTLHDIKKGLGAVKGKSEAATAARLRELVPDLIGVNVCPDFIVNRGHEFGKELSDQEKRDLIEFLKTL